MLLPLLMALWFGYVAARAGRSRWIWALVGLGTSFGLSYVAGTFVAATYGRVTIDEVAMVRIVQLAASIGACGVAGALLPLVLPARGRGAPPVLRDQHDYAALFRGPCLALLFMKLLDGAASLAGEIGINQLVFDVEGMPDPEHLLFLGGVAAAHALLFFLVHWVFHTNRGIVLAWAAAGGALVAGRLLVYPMFFEEYDQPLDTGPLLGAAAGAAVVEGALLAGYVLATRWLGLRWWALMAVATLPSILLHGLRLLEDPKQVDLGHAACTTALHAVIGGGTLYLAVVIHHRMARPAAGA